MKMQPRAALLPFVALFAAAAACACGKAQPDPVAPAATFTPPLLTATPPMVPNLAPVKPVKTCKANADCGQGERCGFVAGCGAPQQCVPDTGCTKDLVPYCGCDGKVFESSGTCAGQPFANRGGCGAR
jgi:hypothetical protein